MKLRTKEERGDGENLSKMSANSYKSKQEIKKDEETSERSKREVPVDKSEKLQAVEDDPVVVKEVPMVQNILKAPPLKKK